MGRNSKYYGIRLDRRSQNFDFHMIARSQLIADDRRRSQTIVEVCFHMIANDRRTFCDLRSAIRDRLRSYGNQPLAQTFWYRRWQNEEHDDKVTLRRNEANKDWMTIKLTYDEVTFNETRLGDEVSQWLYEMINTMLNSKLTIFNGIKKFRRHEM